MNILSHCISSLSGDEKKVNYCNDPEYLDTLANSEDPDQTVKTQIRLLLKQQCDQSLHYLSFRLHILDVLLYGKTTVQITAIFECVQDFSDSLLKEKFQHLLELVPIIFTNYTNLTWNIMKISSFESW